MVKKERSRRESISNHPSNVKAFGVNEAIASFMNESSSYVDRGNAYIDWHNANKNFYGVNDISDWNSLD